MKSKFNTRLLYNPFDRIAGWRAFFVGAIIVVITCVGGWLTGTAAFGMEIKLWPAISLGQALFVTGAGLVSTILIMYVAGLVFSRNVRFQDIAGTVTLARAPYAFSPLVGLVAGDGYVDKVMDSLSRGSIEFLSSGRSIGVIVLSVVITIWAVAMLYNAFRVSTYLKRGKCVALFILSLLLSEILMLFILYLTL